MLISQRLKKLPEIYSCVSFKNTCIYCVYICSYSCARGPHVGTFPSSMWLLGTELKLPSSLEASTPPVKPSRYPLYSCYFIFLKKDLLAFILHAWVFVSMYVSTICVTWTNEGQRKALKRVCLHVCMRNLCACYPWRSEEGMRSPRTGDSKRVSYHLCDGNQNWVFCKSGVCCQLLSHFFALAYLA